MAYDLRETAALAFHGVEYTLTVSTSGGDTLSIEIEQTADAARWRGDFSARYIEDITSKTGNFKKFPVFVKMLLSAVTQVSDSVFVDLLTYQDLEVLKTRKLQEQAGGAAPPPATRPAVPPSNKRYLILTYAAEFDRVHYPLPLLFEEHPDPEHLRQVIVSLRAELDAVRASGGGRHGRGGGGGGGGSHTAADAGGGGAGSAADARRLREENAALRQQLRQLDRAVRHDLTEPERQSAEARDVARELRAVRKERDVLIGRVEAAEAELERASGLHRRELRKRAKEAQGLQDELSAARETIRELRHQVRALTEQLGRRGSGSSGVPSGRRSATYAAAAPSSAYASAERARGVYSASSARHAPYAPGYAAGTFGHHPATRPSSGGPYRDREPSRRDRDRDRDRRSGGSRPSSAPARRYERFDPTEWVRAQRDRERDRGRSSSPGGIGRRASAGYSSAGSSGRASPAASRPGSADRMAARPVWGAGGRPSAVASSRPTSAERSGRRSSGELAQQPPPPPRSAGSSRASSVDRLHRGLPARNGGGPGSDAALYPLYGSSRARASAAPGGSRPSSAEHERMSDRRHAGVGLRDRPGSGGSARPRAPSPRGSWGEASGAMPGPPRDAWSKFPSAGRASGGGGSRPSSRGGSRDASPGRALQEIKRKLSEYVSSSQGSMPSGGAAAAAAAAPPGGVAAPPAPAASTPPGSTTTSKAQLFEDTSVEIADIDSRLHALQDFLRMAKGGAQ